MTARNDDGAEFRAKQEEALKIMAEKEDDTNDPAATNNRLLAKADDLSSDELKASLDLNNPTGSSAAYRDEKAEKKLADERKKAAYKQAKEAK